MKSFLSAIAIAAAGGILLAAQPAMAQHASIYVEPAIVAPAPGYGSGWGWDHRPRYDQRAPRIMDVTPSHGEHVAENRRGMTRITARVHDGGSGIASVRLRVDGRDVSHRIRFDGEEVVFRDDLAPGWHTAELVVRDRAGNVTRRSWSFDVVDRYRVYGYYNRF